MINDIAIFVVVFFMGVLVGMNSRSSKRGEYKKKLLAELDSDITKELQIAKNLNKSLLDDKHELQKKLWEVQGKTPR